jgi:hypothetical protein
VRVVLSQESPFQDGLSAPPTEDRRPDGAEAASGSTIETIWPAEKVKTVLETLQEIAGPEGLPILPFIQRGWRILSASRTCAVSAVLPAAVGLPTRSCAQLRKSPMALLAARHRASL